MGLPAFDPLNDVPFLADFFALSKAGIDDEDMDDPDLALAKLLSMKDQCSGDFLGMSSSSASGSSSFSLLPKNVQRSSIQVPA